MQFRVAKHADEMLSTNLLLWAVGMERAENLKVTSCIVEKLEKQAARAEGHAPAEGLENGVIRPFIRAGFACRDLSALVVRFVL